MIKEEQLERWKSLAASSSPGPWTADLDMFDVADGIEAVVCDADTTPASQAMMFRAGTDITFPTADVWTADLESTKNAAWAKARESQELKNAQFIAEARTAVPALVAEVERLRRVITTVRNDILNHGSYPGGSDRLYGLFKANLLAALEQALHGEDS